MEPLGQKAGTASGGESHDPGAALHESRLPARPLNRRCCPEISFYSEASNLGGGECHHGHLLLIGEPARSKTRSPREVRATHRALRSPTGGDVHEDGNAQAQQVTSLAYRR